MIVEWRGLPVFILLGRVLSAGDSRRPGELVPNLLKEGADQGWLARVVISRRGGNRVMEEERSEGGLQFDRELPDSPAPTPLFPFVELSGEELRLGRRELDRSRD